jgi:hypothetical protein
VAHTVTLSWMLPRQSRWTWPWLWAGQYSEEGTGRDPTGRPHTPAATHLETHCCTQSKLPCGPSRPALDR